MSAAGRAGQRSDCEYRRRRARQIAYGRWEPWARAAPVREHVRALRQTGASYRAIGQAAGVSPMTVHRVLHGDPPEPRVPPERLHVREARCLLAVTAVSLE
ncbi:MAG: helix-turn-helix domain-containing protein, partial [Streptosporangiaceae bacterium]